MILHINYFEQGQTLETACQLASEIGADGIEFRRIPASYRGTPDEYLDEISHALDKHPLSVVAFGMPGCNFMASDAAERAQALESAATFYRKAAGRFPLQTLNMLTGPLLNADPAVPYSDYHRHGSSIASDEQWQNAIEGLRQLGMLAEELKIRFALETHAGYLHDTIPATLRLLKGINSPRIGMLWDQVNLMLLPDCPRIPEVIETAGSQIFYVHLKNLLIPPSQFRAPSSLSAGIVNIRDQVQRLLQFGYTGAFCIETTHSGDRQWQAREDLNYLTAILEDAQSSSTLDRAS